MLKLQIMGHILNKNGVLSRHFLYQLHKTGWNCMKFSHEGNISANWENENSPALHIPVMVDRVLETLNPKPGQTFIDMTFGAGGHSKRLLNAVPNIKIFGLDRDPLAYKIACDVAKQYCGQLIPLLGRFSELPDLLHAHGLDSYSVDGILFDLGCSSMQFDTPERGFSLSKVGPLDMRMDANRYPDHPTAADVLAFIDEDSLVKVLKVYGEEKQAKNITQAIIEARYMFKKLNTTKELADLIFSVFNKENRWDKLHRFAHPATKTFQALRIFVNNEINELNHGLEIAYNYLKPNGILTVLTFHSLEDRIVKRHMFGINLDDPVMKSFQQRYRHAGLWHSKGFLDKILQKRWEVINKHVLLPPEEEVASNPRSRSAKFRASVKAP